MSAESESEKTRFSAKSLRAHEMARGMTPSVYDCVSVTGPPHNRFFTMTCKQGEHITRGKLMWTYNIIPKKNTELFLSFIGTGKSKQIGKNIAASHMLKILSESDQANAQ